ncbi:hypothetical protein [Halovenus salina]|uniref:Uncharacterized protein n=1 Tax=Halovenus salina TaxID=1510225 RepID=A0ABD5W1G0_9EURY
MPITSDEDVLGGEPRIEGTRSAFVTSPRRQSKAGSRRPTSPTSSRFHWRQSTRRWRTTTTTSRRCGHTNTRTPRRSSRSASRR